MSTKRDYAALALLEAIDWRNPQHTWRPADELMANP
jgi:hypothetical protein